jgi:thymidylate synthase
MPVRERVGVTVRFDASRALLVHPARGLNYRFAAAEFLWIAAGLDEVAPLARYNKKMASFSDDGVHLAGAYGPRLASQWDYVLGTLRADPDSRQAVAVIWTPRPAPSKDVPCTVSAQFLVRDGKVTGVWTMRSSDLWLGLPYDAFSFARLTACVAGALGREPGEVVITAGSSHLYEEHWASAEEALTRRAEAWSPNLSSLPGFPPEGADGLLHYGTRPAAAVDAWYWHPWSTYARALEARSSAEALVLLATDDHKDAAA